MRGVGHDINCIMISVINVWLFGVFVITWVVFRNERVVTWINKQIIVIMFWKLVNSLKWWNKGKYFTSNSLSYHFSPFENENYHRFIISLQANNLTSCLMWNIYLYFIILKLFTNFQNIILLVKIVANDPLTFFRCVLYYC
jgi:hypothetical protein